MEPEKETWIKEFYERQRASEIAETISCDARKAMDFLFRSFDRYIESLNSQYGNDSISILALPRGFVSAFFGSGEQDPGFLIIFGREKTVMVFYGKKSEFTFVGRKTGSNSSNLPKNLKLLQVNWKEKGTGEYIFSDSTGVRIRIHELLQRIVLWGTT